MGFSPASSVPSGGGGGGVVEQGARDATAQAWLVDGSGAPVALDAATLAALETIQVGSLPAVALDAASLAALETISVANFPAVQPVSDNGGSLTVDGPLTAAELAAAEPLGVTVGNFPASQAVTGPLTNTELRAAPVAVDASGATVPVSVAVLPLADDAATETTLAAIAETLERAASALDDLAFTSIVRADEAAA